MHSIKNISERNKIDTQSRADTYIRRKRLISKSNYNLKSGCTWKYSWKWIKPQKPSPLGKKTQKTQKTPKTPKKTKKKHWAGLKKKKKRVFSNPDCNCRLVNFNLPQKSGLRFMPPAENKNRCFFLLQQGYWCQFIICCALDQFVIFDKN